MNGKELIHINNFKALQFRRAFFQILNVYSKLLQVILSELI